MKIYDIKTLLIEDDDFFAKKLEFVLPTIGKIRHAYSLAQAYSILKNNQPHLIFLDNRLYDGLGVDGISELKKGAPNAKIILMSSVFDLKDVVDGIKKDVDYIINKKDIKKEKIIDLFNAAEKSIKEKKSLWNLMKGLKGKNSDQKAIENIAIVEDDEMFSFKLEWKLNASFPNALVNTFNNSDSFFKSTKDTAPDLIFLDYYVQDEVGIDILKKIKNKMPKTAVVVVSGQEESANAIAMHKYGIEDYVIKNESLTENLDLIISKYS